MFKAQNAELEKQNILNNDNDEARKQMIEDYEYALELQQKGYEYQKRSLEKQNTVLGLNSSSTNSKKDTIVAKGSIAELDKLIAEAKKKYSNAVTDAARTEALKLIKELEQKKVVLNITAKFNSKDLDELKLPSLKTDKLDTSKIKLDTIKPAITENDVQVNNDYLDSLNGIVGVMGNISQYTKESGAAFITWSANLLSSISAAIPAIEALTAAKKNEAMVNGIASATQTPIIGWVLAAAAVASVVAAFASMPKFADGGIVQGSSFNDGIIARVSTGEMILNRNQQSNLFNLLDRGATNGITSGEVEFKIGEKALIGVLKNYNNRVNRLI